MLASSDNLSVLLLLLCAAPPSVHPCFAPLPCSVLVCIPTTARPVLLFWAIGFFLLQSCFNCSEQEEVGMCSRSMSSRYGRRERLGETPTSGRLLLPSVSPLRAFSPAALSGERFTRSVHQTLKLGQDCWEGVRYEEGDLTCPPPEDPAACCLRPPPPPPLAEATQGF